MAMQMRGADPRLYNPDRDMLWAMPRLMRKALLSFGQNITVAEVRDLLAQRGIALDCEDELVYDKLWDVIQSFARYLNDLKDKPDVRKSPEYIHRRLFTVHPDDVVFAAIRTLVADAFMSAVYAELPSWFESVQPEKANNPVPTVEEVEEAAAHILSTAKHPDSTKQSEKSDE